MSIAPGALERLNVPSLDNTMGAMLIGVLVSTALWGTTCAQAYHYYTHYSDAQLLQMLVFTSILLDTIHQVLISHTIYTYLITWYNNPLNLLHIVWSIKVQILVTAINVLIIEGFLIWRIWCLGGQSLLRVSPLMRFTYPWFISKIDRQTTHLQAILSLASFATEILFYSKTQACDSFLEVDGVLVYAYALGAAAVASHVAITTSLLFLLFTSRDCLPTTNHIIQRLIVFNITTGLPSSLCAILSLVMIIVYPTTLLYAVFYLLLSKLVTNSFLMILNIRARMRNALPRTVMLGSLCFGPVLTDTADAPAAKRHNGADARSSASLNRNHQFGSYVPKVLRGTEQV